MAPIFLTRDDVLAVHADQIARYGGGAGLRDSGGLDAALAQPSATFGGQYLHADLFEMAAACLFHLVQGHPFVDGNKRVGAASALVFLEMNDIAIEADEAAFAELVLAVARGEIGKTEIAEFLRLHAA
jgi:death-on-curing protein